MTASKRVVLLLAFSLALGLLPLVPPSAGTTCTVPAVIELTQTGGSFLPDSAYTWVAVGNASASDGSLLGTMTWNEAGYIAPTGQKSHAVANGTLTTVNGAVIGYELGTPFDPYWFQVTNQSGGFSYFKMQGSLRVGGQSCGVWSADGAGTWADPVLTTT